MLPDIDGLLFGLQYTYEKKMAEENYDKKDEQEKEELQKEIAELKKEVEVFKTAKNPWKDSLNPICETFSLVMERSHADPNYKITQPKFFEEVRANCEKGYVLDYAMTHAWKHVPERLKIMDGRPRKAKKLR